MFVQIHDLINETEAKYDNRYALDTLCTVYFTCCTPRCLGRAPCVRVRRFARVQAYFGRFLIVNN